MPRKSRQRGGEDRSASVPPRGIGRPTRVVQKGSRGDGAVALVLSRRWPLMVALTSIIGVSLGVMMIALNLISVAMPALGSPPLSSSGVVDAPISIPGGGSATNQGPERHSIGSPDAPVVVVEWSDFQCPACRAYALTRDSVLEQAYAGTGQVRFVYRNFAFLGLESILAAQAAEIAGDQGKYWEYRALLWQRQRGENLGTFSAQNLKSFAAELGLNQEAFNTAFDNGVHRAEVLAEQKEGGAAGVNATPTVFVNGRKMQGVPTVEAMKAVIEEELAKKR